MSTPEGPFMDNNSTIEHANENQGDDNQQPTNSTTSLGAAPPRPARPKGYGVGSLVSTMEPLPPGKDIESKPIKQTETKVKAKMEDNENEKEDEDEDDEDGDDDDDWLWKSDSEGDGKEENSTGTKRLTSTKRSEGEEDGDGERKSGLEGADAVRVAQRIAKLEERGNLKVRKSAEKRRKLLEKQALADRSTFLNFDPKKELVLKLYCMTWNMYGLPPPPRKELEKFIPVETFDIYVIGTEECEQSISMAILFSSKAKWTAALTDLMGPHFVQIAAETMQAIHCIAFVRRELAPYITKVETQSVATGLGDVLGNKGGVAISMDIGSTSFLFVNSHFQSGESASQCERRNEDFYKINTRLTLRAPPLEGEGIGMIAGPPAASALRPIPGTTMTPTTTGTTTTSANGLATRSVAASASLPGSRHQQQQVPSRPLLHAPPAHPHPPNLLSSIYGTAPPTTSSSSSSALSSSIPPRALTPDIHTTLHPPPSHHSVSSHPDTLSTHHTSTTKSADDDVSLLPQRRRQSKQFYLQQQQQQQDHNQDQEQHQQRQEKQVGEHVNDKQESTTVAQPGKTVASAETMSPSSSSSPSSLTSNGGTTTNSSTSPSGSTSTSGNSTSVGPPGDNSDPNAPTLAPLPLHRLPYSLDATARFDCVVWMGDFNYRVKATRKVTELLLKAGMREELLNNDELREQMRRGKVFPGFVEAPITFPPTYKYDVDSDLFDTSEKRRTPSWTDRIVWKRNASKMLIERYDSCRTVRTSDHRPVFAHFLVRVGRATQREQMVEQSCDTICPMQ